MFRTLLGGTGSNRGWAVVYTDRSFLNFFLSLPNSGVVPSHRLPTHLSKHLVVTTRYRVSILFDVVCSWNSSVKQPND